LFVSRREVQGVAKDAKLAPSLVSGRGHDLYGGHL
jgi:hypothetical protein